MKKTNGLFTLALALTALLSGCSTVPEKETSLSEESKAGAAKGLVNDYPTRDRVE